MNKASYYDPPVKCSKCRLVNTRPFHMACARDLFECPECMGLYTCPFYCEGAYSPCKLCNAYFMNKTGLSELCHVCSYMSYGPFQREKYNLNGQCHKCQLTTEVFWTFCPYEKKVHGNTTYGWCCSKCRWEADECASDYDY